MDVRYSHDGLHRLKKAEEGTAGSGSSFTVVGLVDDWTATGLSQTGNWLQRALTGAPSGLTGGTTTNTFNRVNELLTATNSSFTTSPVSPQYSANGELTDDARRFSYKYDGWGRLTQVKNKASIPVVIAEYRYNALGYRTGWRYDANFDGTIDGSDPWYWLVYNERWQHVATFRCPTWAAGTLGTSEDNYPKETFIHHQAGIDGFGGSSYVDGVILRDRDGGRESWQDAGAATRGDRLYYLQNWRADTVVTMRDNGDVVDRIRYTAYGEPIFMQEGIYDLGDLVGGDGNPPRDGNTDANDYDAFINWYASDDLRADLVGGNGNPPGDGNVDGNDFSAYLNAYAANGPAYFSDSRRLYAGYEFDPVLGLAGASIYHVRNRVYDAENGRWTKRDPLGYVDGMGLYEYCASRAVEARDASGLAMALCTTTITQGCLILEIMRSIARLAPCQAVRAILAVAPQCACALPVMIGIDAAAIAICFSAYAVPLAAGGAALIPRSVDWFDGLTRPVDIVIPIRRIGDEVTCRARAEALRAVEIEECHVEARNRVQRGDPAYSITGNLAICLKNANDVADQEFIKCMMRG